MLSCGGAGEQPVVYGEGVVVGNHFLEAHDGYMQFGEGGAHVGVTLVGAYDEGSGRGHGEIDSGHGRIGME